MNLKKAILELFFLWVVHLEFHKFNLYNGFLHKINLVPEAHKKGQNN